MKTLSELFKDKKLQDQIVVVNSLTPITVKENIKNAKDSRKRPFQMFFPVSFLLG